MPRWPRLIHRGGTGVGTRSRGRSRGTRGSGRQESALSTSMLPPSLERRVAVLEEGMEISDERLDGMGYQIKVLLAQLVVMNQWIKHKHGVPLINEESQHFQSIIGDFEEIEEVMTSLRNNLIPDANTKTQETQTERESSEMNINKICSEVEVLSNEDAETEASCSERQHEKQRRIIVVNSDDSSSDEDVFVQSEDNRTDSDVSDVMVNMMLGKTVTESGKKKLERFYRSHEFDDFGGGNCISDNPALAKIGPFTPTRGLLPPLPIRTESTSDLAQCISRFSIPTKAARKTFASKASIDANFQPIKRVKKAALNQKRRKKRRPRHKKSLITRRVKVKRGKCKTSAKEGVREGGGRDKQSTTTFPEGKGTLTKRNKASDKFGCKICHKKFSQLWGLWCHIKVRHAKRNLHKCPFCQDKFSTKSETATHVLKFHRKKKVIRKRHKEGNLEKRRRKKDSQTRPLNDPSLESRNAMSDGERISRRTGRTSNKSLSSSRWCNPT